MWFVDMNKTIVLLFLGVLSCQAVLTVPTIKLNDGKDIPALAFGTWLGHNTTGTIHMGTDEVENAVTWALEAGYRHIDTAFKYGIEDQVGRALKKKIDGGIKREEIFVTTKLWNEYHARDAVVPALRASLANLGLDYVDLYLIHWPVGQYANKSFEYTDYLETWRGMLEAKALGLAKSVGLSNFNEKQIDRILENGLEVPAVLQVEFNLNLQQPELLSYCTRRNITVMAYTPFGSLFGSKRSGEAPPPRVDDPALQDIAKKYGKTVPQIVLRYLTELGVIPIPKSLTKSRIEQNLAIFDFHLTDEEKALFKTYDKNYRTLPQTKWGGHPYYPF